MSFFLKKLHKKLISKNRDMFKMCQYEQTYSDALKNPFKFGFKCIFSVSFANIITYKWIQKNYVGSGAPNGSFLRIFVI